MTCAKGESSPRMRRICATVLSKPPSVEICSPKYWTFSLNAKPPAIVAAKTMPSTGPSKYLRATRKIRSTPRPLADSSTMGA